MRRALVTGASRGIGRAIAEMLLAEGWEVYGVSRSEPGIAHERFLWVEWDLSDPWRVAAFSSHTIDALIHCAGIRGPYGPLTENDPGAWVRTIETNLLGTYRVVRAALPRLRQSEDARILLCSGGGAFSPEPNYSAYAVTKGATVALMETLAEELRDSSVSINCLAPGFIKTHIHDNTPDADRVEREGAMGDVLGCVRHLLSPATRGLTGRTVAAQFDDWAHLTPWTVPAVMQGPMGTRTRHTIEQCQRLVRRAI